MPGSGVLAFNAVPAEKTGGGRGGAGSACAAWAGAPDCPAAGIAQEPVGTPESAGTRSRGALSGAADRSPQSAGAVARLGYGSGGQDVCAGEY